MVLAATTYNQSDGRESRHFCFRPIEIRAGDRPGSACPASDRVQDFLLLLTHFGAPPNTHVCPVCLGLPGALPVLNRGAVDCAIRASVALGCTVHETSIFARKNYFYPDLPKGYQISQYKQPLSTGGVIELSSGGEVRRVGI